ncbi:MAG: LamG domain-containing protein [Myxococcota bacterium]|nr:LamG domain-containing protein [Myxococcota bacterium]
MTAALLVACSVPDKQPLTDAGSDGAPGDSNGDLETTIVEAPEPFSRLGSATFKFMSNLPDAKFECMLDDEAPAACTSPFTRSLSDGPHSFAVRAIDSNGTVDDTPAEHLWLIDTVAPNTQLLVAPPAADNSVMVRFEFTSSEMNVTFDCSLDGGSYLPCTSGAEFGPISDGSHSFAVRAHDRAGNVDSSPAIHAWTVDTSTPDTQIVSGPSGSASSTTATFTFLSPDAGGGATFQCSLDTGAFVACTSPQSFTNLVEGEHTFAVRVRDAVGNFDPTPATRTWTVDLSAPETTIDSGPSGTVRIASASFTFSASELNATFACSLDGAPFAACTSPFTATGLAQGAHTFAVKASDTAGHEDPTPATRTWTIDTIPPQIDFTSGPAAGSTSGPRVTFGFTVSDGTVACSMDGAAFAACTSPYATNLPAGAHELQVRATDDAGNIATAVRGWTVACAAPDATGAAGLLHLDDNAQTLANGVAGGASATLGADATVEVADPGFVAGRFGSGLTFSPNEGDHVSWPAALGMMPDLTLELWVRPDAIAGTRDLLVSGDGRVALQVTGASPTTVQFSFSVTGGNGQVRTATSAQVTGNAWHHVIASLDEPTLRLWVDGVRVEAAINLGDAPALDAIRLGGAGGTSFSGTLDEIWIAQTAITADEAALTRYCPM